MQPYFDLTRKKTLKKKWKTMSKNEKKMEDDLILIFLNGRRPQKKMEEEPINQNQPIWL